MHRLFWKIFLSFWGALVLFAAASILTVNLFLEHKRQEQEQVSPREFLRQVVADGQDAADRGGREGLHEWLEHLDRNEVVPFLLLDADDRDLLGRTVPDYLLERQLRLPRRDDERRHPRPASVIRTPQGESYRLVPDFHNVTLARVLVRPRVMAVPVLVAALVSGFVCFLLARYLTRPLTRLHDATEEFAQGNLSQRVAPTLGGRRDEIADLARAFDRMAEQLADLLRSHKQLLSDVSHELRSPLARLQVALELARTRSGDAAHKELDRIALEAERLDELIAQLLSLARLEAQTRPIMHEPVEMQALMVDVVEDARFEARDQNRDIQVTASETLRVMGDPVLLHSALENIVRNAIRHTAEQTSIEISLGGDAENPGFLRLDVRDRGPGVPEELLTKLFEPFVRADAARSRSQGGYGLGLAIARRSIQLHGGSVVAENAVGGGLRVSVRLPLQPR